MGLTVVDGCACFIEIVPCHCYGGFKKESKFVESSAVHNTSTKSQRPVNEITNLKKIKNEVTLVKTFVLENMMKPN